MKQQEVIRSAVGQDSEIIIFKGAIYLEICFEDPDDLGARRPEDCDGFYWQVFGPEAQLGGNGGCNHGGDGLRVSVGGSFDCARAMRPWTIIGFGRAMICQRTRPRRVVCSKGRGNR